MGGAVVFRVLLRAGLPLLSVELCVALQLALL